MSEKQTHPTVTPRRLAAGLMAAGMALSPLSDTPVSHGDHTDKATVISETPEQAKLRAEYQAYQKQIAEAAPAREALAKQYTSCEVTNVTDTHTAVSSQEVAVRDKKRIYNTDRGGNVTAQDEPGRRNEIIVRFTANRTQAAVDAEAKYATDDTVTWNPRTVSAHVITGNPAIDRSDEPVSVPTYTKFTVDGTQIHAETHVFPRLDGPANGRPIALSMGTTAETRYGWEKAETYKDTGTFTCGVIAQGEGGAADWGLLPVDQQPDIPQSSYRHEVIPQ